MKIKWIYNEFSSLNLIYSDSLYFNKNLPQIFFTIILKLF